MKRACDHCGREMDWTGLPEGGQGWCSTQCETAWHDARPGSRDGWIAVENMTPAQRAELEAFLLGGN